MAMHIHPANKSIKDRSWWYPWFSDTDMIYDKLSAIIFPSPRKQYTVPDYLEEVIVGLFEFESSKWLDVELYDWLSQYDNSLKISRISLSNRSWGSLMVVTHSGDNKIEAQELLSTRCRVRFHIKPRNLDKDSPPNSSQCNTERAEHSWLSITLCFSKSFADRDYHLMNSNMNIVIRRLLGLEPATRDLFHEPSTSIRFKECPQSICFRLVPHAAK